MRTTVVASPPTTTGRPQTRSTGDAAAAVFRRQAQWLDALARHAIRVSGVGIIAAVLGIGVFLFLEIVPLFAGAKLSPGAEQVVASGPLVFTAVDEYQELALAVGGEPVLFVADVTGVRAPARHVLEGVAGARVTAAAGTPELLALATDHGHVWLGRSPFTARYVGGRRTVGASLSALGVIGVVPGQAVTRLAVRETDDVVTVAAIAASGHVVITRVTTTEPLVGPIRREVSSLALPRASGEPTAITLDGRATHALVGTGEGTVQRWRITGDTPELVETIRAVGPGRVSALAHMLGDRSVIVGGADGSVATWSLIRDEAAADGFRLTKIHAFPDHQAPVAAVAASPRDKGFLSASDDGWARLHYMTNDRTLAAWRLNGAPTALAFAPKLNGVLAGDADGRLRHWGLENPHPEFSWKALFGKVWYEGYPAPEHVWQSTGGTDDFESKFSLVPLVFGTLKGTVYALLFAVPLALFGALYCSQFLDKHLRAPVKSTLELMAALPSVVLGFVAGVLLAPLVQGRIVSVLSLPVLIPLVALSGMAVCAALPSPALQRSVRQHEFWLLGAWVIAGVLAALWLGPWIERALFGGSFEAWLLRVAGTRYDQRNAMVVGWVMGFAVIPIVFTICEDAFSAVPRHLVGASLACGASPWQTAWRVVLPAAGSGVFSAVMVGFGRAVGETMIVLMATGNTPVMDWSAFNGFRALSANIAVEIPEAPHGGTLYRVLFVASLLLFGMTFVVNTAAEMVRLRLRRNLQGL